MKEKLTKNIGLKLISLVLAVFFWFAINNALDPVTITTIQNIPVEVINQEAMDSASKLVEITSGEKVSVRVRAKKSVANSLTASDFDAIADVTNKNEFNAVPIIVTCNKYGDADIEIISHATEDGTTMMHLSLVELVQRSFGVGIITDGSVKDGYYITDSTVSPNLITIRGSETILSKITRVAVILSVDNAVTDISQTCTVQAYDIDGNVINSDNLEFSESQVKIEMAVVPTKEVEVVINTSGTPADGYYVKNVEYAPHYITVAGRAADLLRINRLTLNCSVSDKDSDMETSLDAAAAIRDQYGDALTTVNDSQKISVRATISEYTKRTVVITPDKVEIRNLSGMFELEIDRSRLEVVLKGPEDAVETVQASDIRAYIDARSFTGVGTFSGVPVGFEPINGITFEPVSVDIVIKPGSTKN